MKKAVLFVALFFVFANVCGAAAYKNHEYNFQLALPGDWRDIKDDLEIADKDCMFVIGKTDARQGELAVITLLAYPVNVQAGLTIDDMPKRDKKQFADMHVKSIKEEGAGVKIKAAAFTKIGAHPALVITYEENAASFVRAIILENKMFYIFYLAAGSLLEERRPQFFQTIESLKPLQ